jgi:hypothetical protein
MKPVMVTTAVGMLCSGLVRFRPKAVVRLHWRLSGRARALVISISKGGRLDSQVARPSIAIATPDCSRAIARRTRVGKSWPKCDERPEWQACAGNPRRTRWCHWQLMSL